MEVHKHSTIAVLPGAAKAPTRIERLPNELPKLKKWMDRVARDGFEARPRTGPSRTSLLHCDNIKGWISSAAATVFTMIPGC